jgi:hypothetical protein
VDTLFKAFKKVSKLLPIRIVFTGTSYAGIGLAKPMMTDLIIKNDVGDFIKEHPNRVGYREALEINKKADMQLLIGDTTPYYAASKMMGLVASGVPFFAWVHADSFPAKFLEELQYPNLLVFRNEQLGTENKVEELAECLLMSLRNREQFVPVSLENPVFKKFTARAMTKNFVDIFQKIIDEEHTL